MSEAAVRKHEALKHWAEPGSRHDIVVRYAKLGLPLIALAFLLLLAVAPFDQRGDVSFILDKKEVDKAAERMRIEAARYSGEDNRGNKFEITAQRAIQQRSDQPVVNIEGMRARARCRAHLEASVRWAERQSAGVTAGSGVSPTTIVRMPEGTRASMSLTAVPHCRSSG